MRSKRAFYKMNKICDEEQKYQVTCKCGTKTVMVWADRALCRGCNHWVYRNKKIEFMEKMKEELKNG